MYCLEPPSSVRNLTIDSVDETTVRLSWRRPVDSGGRSDVWFRVDCDACNEKFVLYRPRQAHLNDTSYVVINTSLSLLCCVKILVALHLFIHVDIVIELEFVGLEIDFDF